MEGQLYIFKKRNGSNEKVGGNTFFALRWELDYEHTLEFLNCSSLFPYPLLSSSAHQLNLVLSCVFYFLTLKHGLLEEHLEHAYYFMLVAGFQNLIIEDAWTVEVFLICLMKLFTQTLLTWLTHLHSLDCDNFQHDPVSKISSERSGTPKSISSTTSYQSYPGKNERKPTMKKHVTTKP